MKKKYYWYALLIAGILGAGILGREVIGNNNHDTITIASWK